MKKEKEKKTSQNVKKQYKDLAELNKQLSSISNKKITKQTFYLDKLLMSKRTFIELVKLNDKFRKAHKDSNDFLTISRIKSHIKYRQDHNKFVYDMTKDENEKESIQLVAVN